MVLSQSAGTPYANITYEPPIKNSVSVAKGSTSVSNKHRHSLTKGTLCCYECSLCCVTIGSSAKRLDTGGASQGNNIDTRYLMQAPMQRIRTNY
nr:hypothetical protein [Tanacetum cinerariifolium]